MRRNLRTEPSITEVTYLIPPAAERLGGIDTALDGLHRHLATGTETRITLSETNFTPNSDVVHFHGMWQIQHGKTYRECLMQDIPYVISPHGMLEPWAWKHKIWKKWPYYQLVARRQLRNAATIIAASKLEADNLEKFVSKDRIQVLPFGIDEANLPDRTEARKRLGFDDDQKILLYFSRIDRKKGLDLLLESLREVPANGWRLVIAGNGDAEFEHELKAYAETHRHQLPPITWAGGVWGHDRWDYLSGTDLFCLPTRSENFGFAVLEAMWAGTPVVTTNATPWEQHRIINGIDIATPDIRSLRQTLRNTMSGSNLTQERRSSLREWCVDTYHWKTIAAQYSTAYASLVNDSSTTPCLVS